MKLFGRKKKEKEEKPEVRMEFKVAGVTFDNDDGKNRQEILKKFAKIAKKTDIFEPYGGVTERDIYELDSIEYEIQGSAANSLFWTDEDFDNLVEFYAEPTVFNGHPAVAIESNFGRVGFVPSDAVEEFEEKAAGSSMPYITGKLIECKPSSENLDKHSSQLFRYFSTTTAKFAILTNGIIYKFYTDLDEPNKMDLIPFMELDMLNLKDGLIPEIKKFAKPNFDKEMIFSTAEDLKYSSLIKDYFKNEADNPSNTFVKEILAQTYEGQRTQKIVDKFKPLVKKAFNSFINDLVNQKISAALSQDDDSDVEPEEVPIPHESKIVTTEEELEAYYIVRGLLAGAAPVQNITYRDTESYFGILYQDNNRKPICRIGIGSKQKQILIPDENKHFERHYLESLNDIYKYKKELIDVVKRYL